MRTWCFLSPLLAFVICSHYESSQAAQIVFPVVNCENAKADVVFVLDSSGSVRAWNFKKMLTFLRGIIQRFNVGIDYMRVSLLRFNTQVIPEFQLNQYTHIENLLERLEAVEYTTGTTNMAGALRYVWKESYRAENGGRSDARRIAIIISDGRSDNRIWTRNEAVKCKERNVTLFALGIGNKVDRDELQDIGSDPNSKHVIFYDDFNSLNGTQMMIADNVCTYSRPKLKEKGGPTSVGQDQSLDGGTIAGIVLGALSLICLILAYPGYVISKKCIFGGKEKNKKRKRLKTAPHKRGHKKGSQRGKTAHRRRHRPGSHSSRSSDYSGGPASISHTHTPLRPGTSSLSRQNSYGSFQPDPRPKDKAVENIPMVPMSRGSDSQGRAINQEKLGSSVTDGPPGIGRGAGALPPGLERAIHLMRRQKTMTQHPAPGQMVPPGLGVRQGIVMAPPLGGRLGAIVTPNSGSYILRPREMVAPGSVAPMGIMRGPPPSAHHQRSPSQKPPMIDVHATLPPAVMMSIQDKGLPYKPHGRAIKLEPLKTANKLSTDKDGAVDPKRLADRLRDLQGPIPKVVLHGQDHFSDRSEDQL